MCIYIHDVTAYFTIRNCFINSSTGPSDPGIYLYNASHARIENTVITWHTYAIYAQDCPDVVIDGCTITESFANTIWIIECNRTVLSNCEVFNNEFRIYIQNSDYVTIYNNEIHDNNLQGLLIETSDFLNITGNAIENNEEDGIYLDLCNNATIYDNDLVKNEYVEGSIYLNDNGLYIFNVYDSVIEGNRVWNNSHYGLYIEDSGNNQIKDNQVFDNPRLGIYLSFSDSNNITGNEVWGNGWKLSADGSGIFISQTMGCLIEDNHFWNNLDSGIFLDDAQGCLIKNNQIWNNSHAGIYLEDGSDYTQIEDNQIFNNSVHGISVYESYYNNVTGNDIWNNGWNQTVPGCGIFVVSAAGWLIEDNRIWNNTDDGIHMDSGDGAILNNEIRDNNRDGIRLILDGPYIVDGNTIHRNKNCGISADLNGHANITNNNICDNTVGVEIENSMGSWIYGNDIGWNSMENAIDNSPNIQWHDNVSIGNWWSDYGGTGSYGITNGTYIVNFDLYPHKSLELGGLTGLSYEFGGTGSVGVWFAQALNPSHFEVYANGSLLYSETWDGTSIETNLDGLPVGYNEIMLIAYHISGHSINASTSVTVTDTTGPSWVTTPTDQEITVGESFSYQVTATDLSGIGSYSLNDTVHFQISATGLITNIVPLEIGVYGLQITVVDIYGNELTTAITVTVVAAPPNDMTPYLIVAVGAGVIIIALALVIFMKKQTRLKKAREF